MLIFRILITWRPSAIIWTQNFFHYFSRFPGPFWRLLKFNPPPSGMPNCTFLPQVSLNFFLKSLFYIFSVFLSPWSFDWAPFRLSRAIFRILTSWRPSAIFVTENFFHYFFRFLGPKSFRMSPILYGFEDFWSLPPGRQNVHFWPKFFTKYLGQEKNFELFGVSLQRLYRFQIQKRARPIRGRKNRFWENSEK